MPKLPVDSDGETGKRGNGETGKVRFSFSPFRLFAFSPSLRTHGFTLLEVLVAMAVLAVALVSLLGLYNRSLLLTIQAQRLSTATLLAQEILTRTQLEGTAAARLTSGNFATLHPGQYPEFRWQRTIRSTPFPGLWEIHVGVSWSERKDETCELTLFSSLENS